MNHPITPPLQLVQQWINEEDGLTAGHIVTQAARWGADQELETCVTWLDKNGLGPNSLGRLRAARRPTPPTLKEQALAELEILRIDANTHGLGFDAPAIRRALEALPND
jgi:hypothetical protein